MSSSDFPENMGPVIISIRPGGGSTASFSRCGVGVGVDIRLGASGGDGCGYRKWRGCSGRWISWGETMEIVRLSHKDARKSESGVKELLIQLDRGQRQLVILSQSFI